MINTIEEISKELGRQGAGYALAMIRANVARELGNDEPTDPFMNVGDFGGNNEPTLAHRTFLVGA